MLDGFAGNRAGGEYTTFWLLEKFLAEQAKRAAKAVATGDVATGRAKTVKTQAWTGLL